MEEAKQKCKGENWGGRGGGGEEEREQKGRREGVKVIRILLDSESKEAEVVW